MMFWAVARCGWSGASSATLPLRETFRRGDGARATRLASKASSAACSFGVGS